ncbi:hypothetical protein AABB24_036045, partial [Solanum stoloniferum]
LVRHSYLIFSKEISIPKFLRRRLFAEIVCSPAPAAMAAKSAAIRKSSHGSENFIQKLVKNPKISFAIALLIADSILVALIIAYVPYTKIDWDAYMSQVTGFLEGERDYSNLKGDTGPLVYPAGFLYIYSAIQYVTGGQVYPAQVILLLSPFPGGTSFCGDRHA